MPKIQEVDDPKIQEVDDSSSDEEAPDLQNVDVSCS